MAVPIGTQQEPLGVLTLDDVQERRFTPPVVDLAEQPPRTRAGAAVRRLLREGAGAATAGAAFLVVLANAGEQMACAVAQRLWDAAEEAVDVDGVPVQVGASIGVAMGGADLTAAELIKRADTAMYEVKRTTGSGWGLAQASAPRTERGAAG